MKTKLPYSLCFFLFFIFHLALFTCSAQAPDWIWAKSAGGDSISYDNGDDYASSMCTDHNGNIIVAGSSASKSITFGSIILNNPNPGQQNMILVKYNSAGNVLWAKSAGATPSVINAVAVDTLGNIYVTGGYSSATINFGSITLTNISSPGHFDIFLVKYDKNGNVLWAKSIGGDYEDYVNSISIDVSGNILIGGIFESYNILFGSTTLNNTTNHREGNMFLAKYDLNGNALWALSTGGTLTSLCTDKSNNIIVVGGFGDHITFDHFTLTGLGMGDVFIVKYDSNGNVFWAQSIGGSKLDVAASVSTDDSGNVLVAGNYESSTILFSSSLFALSNADTFSSDILLAKYDTYGNVVWAEHFGNTYGEDANSLTTDGSGNIYMAGDFYDNLIQFGNTTLYNEGRPYADLFLVKLDVNGKVIWAKSSGGTFHDFPTSVCIDILGDILVAGNFQSGDISFGSTSLNNSRQPLYDMFLAKLSAYGTQIENPKTVDPFSIYPNPFHSSTTIHFNSTQNNSELIIYNLMGEELRTIKNISGDEIKLIRDDLMEGNYFVRIREDDGNSTAGKLIITD